MNTAATLLERLAALGVAVVANGDKLRLQPAESISANMVEELREHKAEIISFLNTRIICGTCQHVIDLDVEDWRYRIIDAEPLCQPCGEQADAEYSSWESRRHS